MYVKFTVDGPLEEIVRVIWPEPEYNLVRDYENVYEWVGLEIPNLKMFLNISREHEWGEEKRVYPIYLSAMDQTKKLFIDPIPAEILDRLGSRLKTQVQIFAGRHNVEVPDGTPIRIVNRET